MNAVDVERWRGERMQAMFDRLKDWQRDPYSQMFWLDIEEACEVLEPLLRAALHLREKPGGLR